MVQDPTATPTTPPAPPPTEAAAPVVEPPKPQTIVDIALARVDELKAQEEKKARDIVTQNREIVEVLPLAKREEILGKLVPEQQELYRGMKADLEKVKRNNPGIDTEILDSYESMWLKTQLDVRDKRDELIRENSPVAGNDDFFYNMQKAQVKKWQVQANRKYGIDGALSLGALDEMKKPVGAIEGLTKNFYDKTDGGIQWGGILGAVGGVMLGMMGGEMFGAGGGWMSLLLIAGGALLGGMIGNKGGDVVSGMMYKGKEKTPPGPMDAVQLQLEQEQQQTEKKPSKETLTLKETMRINTARVEMKQKGASDSEISEFIGRALEKAHENPDLNVADIHKNLTDIMKNEKAREEAASAPINLGTDSVDIDTPDSFAPSSGGKGPNPRPATRQTNTKR